MRGGRMYSIQLEVDSSTYEEVMQLLSKVKVLSLKTKQVSNLENSSNREQILDLFRQADPMFQSIEEPVAGQKSLRDELIEEALDDVEFGRVVSHDAVKKWAASLNTTNPLAKPI